MRTIIVGQAPGPTADPRDPLGSGRSGDFLVTLSGAISREQFDRYFERRNLLDHYPGPRGPKGDAFPISEARHAAAWLVQELHGRRVILLGDGVREAFWLRKETPKLVWIEGKLMTLALVPHPSPINRWWNVETNKINAARFFGKALRESVQEWERSVA